MTAFLAREEIKAAGTGPGRCVVMAHIVVYYAADSWRDKREAAEMAERIRGIGESVHVEGYLTPGGSAR